MLTKCLYCLALLGISMEDVILLKCFKLSKEASPLPQFLADIHGVIKGAIPKSQVLDMRIKELPDRYIERPASCAEDVGFLHVNLLDEASSDVPCGVCVGEVAGRGGHIAQAVRILYPFLWAQQPVARLQLSCKGPPVPNVDVHYFANKWSSIIVVVAQAYYQGLPEGK